MMKPKTILTSKLESLEPDSDIPLLVGKPEPLLKMPPKDRRLENQTYLRKININRPIIYASPQSDSPLNSDRSFKKKRPTLIRKPRRDRVESPQEHQVTDFTRHCEKLESQRLEELHFELFPTELNESLVRLPDIQYVHYQGEYQIEQPKPKLEPVYSKSKSPPTLGNILNTSNKRRGRVNYSNILENKFYDHVPKTTQRRPSRELEYYRERISKAKRLKEAFFSLYE